jgi:N-methylhydantoinase B/oxoprolinase/acetone carboxylase alpha subunit
MENETETDLDAELASLRKAVDEHEAIIQTLIGINQTRLTFDEQRHKTSEYQKKRIDELEKKLADLLKIIAKK